MVNLSTKLRLLIAVSAVVMIIELFLLSYLNIYSLLTLLILFFLSVTLSGLYDKYNTD